MTVKAAASSQAPATPSLTTQAFWLMVARFIGYACSFALPLVLARVFTTVEFGLYKQAFLVVMTLGAVLPLNFSLSAFYFLPRETLRRPAVVLNVVLAYMVTATAGLAAVAFVPGFLQLLLGQTALSKHSGLLGIVVFFWTFSALAESLATANQDVRYSTQFIIGAQLTKTLLLVSAAVVYRTVEAVLWAAVIQGVVQSTTLVWYSSKRFHRWWRSFDGELMKEQLKYVLPFGFSAILWKLQMDLHSFLIANKFSDSEFAIYAVGVSQLPLIYLFRESINSVLLARMSALQHSNQEREMIRLFFTAMRKLAIAYLPAVAVLLVLGRELIIVMYTRAYESSWPIFAMNLVPLLVSIVSVDAILRAYADWRFFLVKLRIALIIFLLITSLAAITRFGMIGGISALVFTLVIERLILAVAVAKMLHMRWADCKAAVPVLHLALASSVAAVGAAGVRVITLPYGSLLTVFTAGLSFAAIYATIVVAARLLDDTETAAVRRLTARIMRPVRGT
jgi:O-antigen/teichoic acid export membrane protein